MIYLDDPKRLGPGRLAKSERIEPRAKEYVLRDAEPGGSLQFVLGKPAAKDEGGAEMSHQGALKLGLSLANLGFGPSFDEARRNRVGEDLGIGVKHLVGCTQNSRQDCGYARLSCPHLAPPTRRMTDWLQLQRTALTVSTPP